MKRLTLVIVLMLLFSGLVIIGNTKNANASGEYIFGNEATNVFKVSNNPEKDLLLSSTLNPEKWDLSLESIFGSNYNIPISGLLKDSYGNLYVIDVKNYGGSIEIVKIATNGEIIWTNEWNAPSSYTVEYGGGFVHGNSLVIEIEYISTSNYKFAYGKLEEFDLSGNGIAENQVSIEGILNPVYYSADNSEIFSSYIANVGNFLCEYSFSSHNIVRKGTLYENEGGKIVVTPSNTILYTVKDGSEVGIYEVNYSSNTPQTMGIEYKGNIKPNWINGVSVQDMIYIGNYLYVFYHNETQDFTPKNYIFKYEQSGDNFTEISFKEYLSGDGWLIDALFYYPDVDADDIFLLIEGNANNEEMLGVLNINTYDFTYDKTLNEWGYIESCGTQGTFHNFISTLDGMVYAVKECQDSHGYLHGEVWALNILNDLNVGSSPYTSTNYPVMVGVIEPQTVLSDGTLIGIREDSAGNPKDIVAIGNEIYPVRNLKGKYIRDSKEIELTWEDPEFLGNPELSTYFIYRNRWDNFTNATLIGSVARQSQDRFIDNQVVEGEYYYYWVVGKNGAMQDNPVEYGMYADAVPLPPQNLTAFYGKANGVIDWGITLEWDKPSDDGGFPIESYYVYKGTNVTNMQLLTQVNNKTFHIFDNNVVLGKGYYYYVVAENKLGKSDPSWVYLAPAMVTTSPTNVKITRGIGWINVSWGEPEKFNGSAPLWYNIYRNASGSTSHFVLYKIVGNHTFYLNDTNIVAGYRYYYYITANNSVGESSKSKIVSIVAVGKPSQPRNVEVYQKGNELILTWVMPDNNGGVPIEKYEIYRGTSKGNEKLIATVDGSTTEYKDTNIEVGKTYYYYVVAVNGANVKSNPSQEVSITVQNSTQQNPRGKESGINITSYFPYLLIILLIVAIIIYIEYKKRER